MYVVSIESLPPAILSLATLVFTEARTGRLRPRAGVGAAASRKLRGRSSRGEELVQQRFGGRSRTHLEQLPQGNEEGTDAERQFVFFKIHTLDRCEVCERSIDHTRRQAFPATSEALGARVPQA